MIYSVMERSLAAALGISEASIRHYLTKNDEFKRGTFTAVGLLQLGRLLIAGGLFTWRPL
jgi:hypothetical protein